MTPVEVAPNATESIAPRYTVDVGPGGRRLDQVMLPECRAHDFEQFVLYEAFTAAAVVTDELVRIAVGIEEW